MYKSIIKIFIVTLLVFGVTKFINGTNNINNINNIKENNSNDYSVAVSSSTYNAIVLLNNKSKEITIKLLDKNDLDISTTDKYINFSDSDLKYLFSNSSDLIEQFEDSSLLDKYDMLKNMLKRYDTNINESDLINLAFAYLK